MVWKRPVPHRLLVSHRLTVTRVRAVTGRQVATITINAIKPHAPIYKPKIQSPKQNTVKIPSSVSTTPKTESFKTLSLDAGGSVLTIGFEENVKSSFHAIWLRDHCRCHQCYHPMTKQRLLDTSMIDPNISIKRASLNSGGMQIDVTYNGEGDHVSTFTLEWLRQNSYFPRVRIPTDHLKPKLKLWGSELTKDLPTTPYDEVMAGDAGLAKWLGNIEQYGIGFVSGVPATPQATEDLAKRISFIRETHYGRFWDFSANNAHGDTAYTSIALPAHTDTTYFNDPVGIQVFHLLEHTGKGGHSLYVDGFNVAAQLRSQNPDAYNTLSTLRIPTHCAGDDNVMILQHPGRPILNHCPVTGDLEQVRFNNDDRSPLSTFQNGANDVLSFYAALRAWTRLLRNSANEMWVQLRPGIVVAMDNWRVLHGRSAFTGYRRMAGSYHSHDDYRSRVRTICYGREGFGL